MIITEKLKSILGRKVKLNDGKRDLDINIAELAREIGCSSSDVKTSLKQLQYAGEIKRLLQVGWSKDEYTLTVLEKTTI
jgi:MarR-like DNA-binding transcriptional regulator SgrR of sgrS sRNA